MAIGTVNGLISQAYATPTARVAASVSVQKAATETVALAVATLIATTVPVDQYIPGQAFGPSATYGCPCKS